MGDNEVKPTFRDSAERWSPALALIGGAFFVVAAIAWLLGGSPEGPRFLPLVQIALAAGVVLLLAALAVRPSLWAGWIGVRRLRYGTNAAIMVIAFLAIIVLINYVAKQPRFSAQWDLTEQQELTLTQRTLDLISGLAEPVRVIGFYTPDQSSAQTNAQELLKRYAVVNPGKFSYQFLDPYTDGLPLATTFGLTQADVGSMYAVVGQGNALQREKISGSTEEAISTAIYRVTHPSRKVVSFLQGHGEMSLQQGAANAKNALEQLNYVVRAVVITGTQTFTDTSVLVIAAPLTDLTQPEMNAVRGLLDQGKGVLLLVDPDAVIEANLNSQGLQPHPFDGALATYLSASWGITLSQDLVLDNQYISSIGPTAPVVVSYPAHQITTGQAKLSLPTVLLNVRSIQVATTPPEGVSISPVLVSSSQSYGETNIAELSSQPTYNPGQDLPGPLNMAVAANNGTTQGRLVVVGSGSLIDDRYAIAETGAANRALFERMVNWLVREESTFTTDRAAPVERQIVATQSTSNYVALTSVCLIPGLVVVAGVVVFFQRRRQH